MASEQITLIAPIASFVRATDAELRAAERLDASVAYALHVTERSDGSVD